MKDDVVPICTGFRAFDKVTLTRVPTLVAKPVKVILVEVTLQEEGEQPEIRP